MADSATLSIEDFTKEVAYDISSRLKLDEKFSENLAKNIAVEITKEFSKNQKKLPIQQKESKNNDTTPDSQVDIKEISKEIGEAFKKNIPLLVRSQFSNNKKLSSNEKSGWFSSIKNIVQKVQAFDKKIERNLNFVLNRKKEENLTFKELNRTNKKENEHQESILEKKEEVLSVVIEDFSDKSLKTLGDALPKILDVKAILEGLKNKKEKVHDNSEGQKKLPVGIMKGIFGAAATLGGLASIFYGLQTDSAFKGIAKIVGKGLLSVGGFSKQIQKIVVSIADKLINLPKKLIRGFAKNIGRIFGKEAGKGVLKTGLGSLKGFIPKMLGGALKILKKIPIVGSLISIGFAVSRFRSGDYLGGGLEILSGLLGLIPPPFGTILSIAVDAFNAFLDFKSGGIGGEKNKKKSGMAKGFFSNIGKWLWDKAKKLPIIGSIIEAGQSFIAGDWLKGLGSLLRATPLGMVAFTVLDLFSEKEEDGTKDKKSKGISNFFSNIGKWLWDKAKKLPIIGSIIEAGQSFIAGDWLKGLTSLMKMSPFGGIAISVIEMLSGKTEEETETNFPKLSNPFKAIKDALSNKIKEWWSNTHSWVKNTAKKLWPTNLLNYFYRKDEDQQQSPQSIKDQTSSPVKQGNAVITIGDKTMSMDEYEEWAKNNNPVVETQPSPDLQTTSETSTASLFINNDALSEIAKNTNRTNQNMSNLAAGFNAMAQALEKLGVLIKNNGGNTTVINQNNNKMTKTTIPHTALAQAGNKDIKDYRNIVEVTRLIPA